MNYLTNNNWVYKAGCASMITALALGARYGRVGAIPDAKVIVFNRALTYHIITCTNHHYSAVGLFAASMIKPPKPSLHIGIATGTFLLGIVCFIAPLYYAAIQGTD